MGFFRKWMFETVKSVAGKMDKINVYQMCADTTSQQVTVKNKENVVRNITVHNLKLVYLLWLAGNAVAGMAFLLEMVVYWFKLIHNNNAC